jgi:RNA polymerase sigma-70 factor (ECF subfamily)
VTTGRLAHAAEAAVVALARTGDAAAFVELVSRREAGLRGMLARLSGDATLAEDLAQQAFFAAWKALPGLREPAAFGGWLKRIAVHAWLAHARRAGHDLVQLDEADGVIDPLARSAAAETRLDLSRALEALRPAERTCLVLAHGEGMTHEEIATATGLPLGTVKSNIARGGARLRALLAPRSEPSEVRHA